MTEDRKKRYGIFNTKRKKPVTPKGGKVVIPKLENLSDIGSDNSDQDKKEADKSPVPDTSYRT